MKDATADLATSLRVVVLGAGVIGLTTAFELRQWGIDFEHYAAAADPETTSNIAGGLWLPASVDLAEIRSAPTESLRRLIESSRVYPRLASQCGK